MRPSSRARICARAGRRRRAPVVAVARRSSPSRAGRRRRSNRRDADSPASRRDADVKSGGGRTIEGARPSRRARDRASTSAPRARTNETQSWEGHCVARPAGRAGRRVECCVASARGDGRRGVWRGGRTARHALRHDGYVAPGGQSRRGDGDNATARDGDDTKTRDGARRTGRPCSSSAATSTTLGRSTCVRREMMTRAACQEWAAQRRLDLRVRVTAGGRGAARAACVRQDDDAGGICQERRSHRHHE